MLTPYAFTVGLSALAMCLAADVKSPRIFSGAVLILIVATIVNHIGG